ncbi:MAG: DUF952 domain-containing protein [Pseudomonadota bacterium]
MNKHPEFVYRLATRDEWFIAEETGVAPTRDIDKRDGYIHLSTREQVIETANLHFAGTPDLLALEIPSAPLINQIRFELAPKRGEAFPHLYGALTRDHVARVLRLVESGDGFAFGEPL